MLRIHYNLLMFAISCTFTTIKQTVVFTPLEKNSLVSCRSLRAYSCILFSVWALTGYQAHLIVPKACYCVLSAAMAVAVSIPAVLQKQGIINKLQPHFK